MKPKLSSKARAARCLARRNARRARANRPAATQPVASSQASETTSALARWAMAGVLAASAVMSAAPRIADAQAAAPRSVPSASALNELGSAQRFEIPAGKLSAVLAAFSLKTGITITDPSAVVGDADSQGITANATPVQALRRLLNGTGVTYRIATSRAVTLDRGALPRLATVQVTAQQQALTNPKYSEPLRDVPQTITVVSRQVLDAQGVTSLRDAVRNVTGLTVNAGEGGATPGDNFNIRGFSARSDIFVDGMRDVGGYSRETFNVEQIEVAKGPGSVYSGRGSTGGSINLVTKTPHVGKAYSGVFGAGNAQYGRASVDLNQDFESLGAKSVAMRLNGQWQNAGVANLDVVKNASWGVAPSLAFGLGTTTPVTLQYFHNEQRNIPTYGLSNATTDGPPVGVDPHRYFGLKELDRENVKADQATAKIVHQFGGNISLRNQTSWGASDVHRIVVQANTDGTRRSPSHITYDQNLSNQTSLSASFYTGPVKHVVASGAEVTHEKSRFAAYVFSAALPKVDLQNPNPDDHYTGTITEGRPRRSAIADSKALYTFDTMELSEHLEVNIGVRWDAFSPQYRDSLDRELPKKDSKAATWRTGAVYKPVERGSIYVAYGTSFNPTGELLSLDSRGTIGLDPETNKSYEVGSKWEFGGGRLLVTGSLFRTDKTNARITDPADPSGATLILAGQQRVDGAELGASGQIIPGWTLQAGYTRLDGHILHGTVGTDGTPLPNTPKHSLSVWSSGILPGKIEVGGGVRFVDKRYRTATQSVPGYWAYDADAAYTVSERMSLRLNLINLSDVTYYDSGRFWVPAAGRTIKLSTNVKY